MSTNLSARIDKHFASLADPRRGKVTYPLINILTIALCATIAGADDFGDGDEVIGPGDGGAQGDGEDVDEGIGDLAPAGIGQAGEVLVDASGEVGGHEGGAQEAATALASPRSTTSLEPPCHDLPRLPNMAQSPWGSGVGAVAI